MMKVGVIGAGKMGQNHARVYSEIAELVGIADINKEECKKVAMRYGCGFYTNYKELLKKDLDAVSIATPTKTHYEIALESINAGKNIIIEKPICSEIQDAEKIIEKSEKQGIVLAVGHIERYNPTVRFAKDSLTKKRFGSLITISAKRVSSFPPRVRDVGVIFDLGIHDIDVMRYLVGKEVEIVYALAGSAGNMQYEDHASILLKFENDISGFIETNWLTPMKVRKLFLTCSEKFLEVDYMAQSVKISSSTVVGYDVANLFKTAFEFDTREISLKREEPLKNELNDFLSAVKKKRKPLVSGTDGLRAIQIALAATKSYKTKKRVELSGLYG